MEQKQKIFYLSLAGTIIFILILHFLIVSPLKSLPSPLYGGDYYYQLGQTNHVKYGGNPLQSGNINGDLPGYFVLYSAATGTIARVFSLDAIQAEFVFSYIIIAIATAVLFLLVYKLFKDYLLSIIGVLVYFTAGYVMVLKYTALAYALMIPALILAIYCFVEKPSLRNSIILGLVYGLVGITHSVAFISASFLLAAAFIYYGVIKTIKSKQKLDFKKFFGIVWPYAIVLVIGVAIALLWWFKPLFVYSFSQNTIWRKALLPRWDLAYQFSFLWNMIKGNLLTFSSIGSAVFSVFMIIGLASLFLVKKDKPSLKFISFLFISSLIITCHVFITQNLFGFNFAPDYMVYLLMTPINTLVFIFGIHITSQMAHRIKIKEKMQALIKYAFLCLIILLLLIAQYKAYVSFKQDKWYGAGINPPPENLLALRDYMAANTNVKDTILTANEVGFAVNSITGRKLVITRRAQNDAYSDLESRELAAAIIFYGNDAQAKKELLKKYDVRYLYWDSYWIQSEYSFNQQGQITSWFDPIVLFDTASTRDMLQKYNISYFSQNTWLDPASKGDNFNKFDFIFISPQNYVNFTHPWNPNLDGYLQEVWAYPQGGQVMSRLYKIVGIE